MENYSRNIVPSSRLADLRRRKAKAGAPYKTKPSEFEQFRIELAGPRDAESKRLEGDGPEAA